MDINISVAGKRATVVGTPAIVCGNSDYTITFTFDKDWSAYESKVARFVYAVDGALKYKDVPFEGDTVAVPRLVNVQVLRVGVFAGDLSTTTPAIIPCELSIRCGTSTPEELTPTQYDELKALYTKLEAKIDNAGGSFNVTVTGEVDTSTLSSRALYSDGTYLKLLTLDKTFAEIKAAHDAGKDVVIWCDFAYIMALTPRGGVVFTPPIVAFRLLAVQEGTVYFNTDVMQGVCWGMELYDDEWCEAYAKEFQGMTDYNLETENKTIAGAINEVNADRIKTVAPATIEELMALDPGMYNCQEAMAYNLVYKDSYYTLPISGIFAVANAINGNKLFAVYEYGQFYQVNAKNELVTYGSLDAEVDKLKYAVGDTAELATTNKDNLVNAINEVNEKIPYYKRELVLELTQDDFTVITEDDGYTYLQYTTDKLNWITSVDDVGYELNLITHNNSTNEDKYPFELFDSNENGIAMGHDGIFIDNGYYVADKTLIIINDTEGIGEFTLKLYNKIVKRLPIECENQIIGAYDSENDKVFFPEKISVMYKDTSINGLAIDEWGELQLDSRFYSVNSNEPLNAGTLAFSSTSTVGTVRTFYKQGIINYGFIDTFEDVRMVRYVRFKIEGNSYLVRLTQANVGKLSAIWTGVFSTIDFAVYTVAATRNAEDESLVDIKIKRVI